MKTRKTYTLDPEVADAVSAHSKLKHRSASWILNEILRKVFKIPDKPNLRDD